MDAFFTTYLGQLTVSYALLALVTLGFFVTFTAGQLSIAHQLFMGAGAYVSAMATVLAGWPFLPAALLGTLVAAALGVVVSMTSWRLSGLYLAIATLAIAQSAVVLANNIRLIGDARGFGGIPFHGRPVLIWLVLLAVVVLTALLMRSGMGLRFRATGDDELLAASVGVNVRAVKATAFGAGALMAGLAGVLYAHHFGFVAPHTFSLTLAIQVILAAKLGGAGTVAGPLVGVLPIIALPELLRGTWLDRDLLFGIILVVMVTLRPQGLLGTRAAVRRSTRAVRARLGIRAEGQGGKAGARGPRPGRLPATIAGSGPASAPAGSREAVSVAGVTKRFGGLLALNDVSFEVAQGSIVGLIGPNGAGKTTLINVLSGVLRPDEGTVRFQGEDVTSVAAPKRSRLGIARTFQTARLFPQLTVLENVLSSRWAGSVKLPDASERSDARELLGYFGMGARADEFPDVLPFADRRRLEIARALLAGPQVMLLDEPAAGMNPTEAQALMVQLRAIRDEVGVALLLVEHHVNLVMDTADHIVVVNFGELIARGAPGEVRANQLVIDAYLGSSLQEHE